MVYLGFLAKDFGVSDIFNCARRCCKKKEIGEIYLGEKAFKG